MSIRSDSTEVILVRHGQTEWNRMQRFRGRVDIPLNATGRVQAKSIARRLARRGIPATIFASPLGRCVQTAKAIAAATGAQVQILEGIVDLDSGDWQGLTPDEVEKRYPDMYRTWLSAPQDARIPRGETLDHVRARAVAALEQCTERHTGQRIVLVSHDAVCKVLVCAVLGLDNSHFWRIKQDNAAINIFERRGEDYIIKTINDTCHVEGA